MVIQPRNYNEAIPNKFIKKTPAIMPEPPLSRSNLQLIHSEFQYDRIMIGIPIVILDIHRCRRKIIRNQESVDNRLVRDPRLKRNIRAAAGRDFIGVICPNKVIPFCQIRGVHRKNPIWNLLLGRKEIHRTGDVVIEITARDHIISLFALLNQHLVKQGQLLRANRSALIVG